MHVCVEVCVCVCMCVCVCVCVCVCACVWLYTGVLGEHAHLERQANVSKHST